MDTILFFCKKKGISKPVIEPIGMRTHLLIRIFMDVEPEEWFGVKLECEVPRTMIPAGEEGRAERTRNRVLVRGEDRKFGTKQDCDSSKRTKTRGEEEYGKIKGTKVGSTETEGIITCEKNNITSFMEPVRTLIGFFDVRGRIAKKHRQKEQERQYVRRLQEHEKMLKWIEESVQKLASDILEMTVSWKDCFCVYEDCVRKVLVGKESGNCIGTEVEREDNMHINVSFDRGHILWEVWRKYFGIEEFHGYVQRLWVEEVLIKAVLPHFVILGTAPCLPDIIEKYAHKMKSLRWIMPENEYNQEIQEFMEDFYTEYGLAIMPLVVPAGQRRIQAVCTESSNILDFTQEAQRNFRQTAKGSIWLDMLSIEEKRRVCDTEIAYFSLKEKWKAVRKKEPFIPPDTAYVKM